jgi:A/G-specific adenine glycosylase
MLQQTRVDVVLDRYRAFTDEFPGIADLARATETEVTAAWSGLGYYRRARALHAAARIIVSEHEGRLPASTKALESFPGIGPYTARAVASIAFGLPVAVVDGNVERVIGRIFALDRPRPKDVQELADRLLAARHPGDWNQAMMELGATVCLPARPRCERCPVRRRCAAFASGRPGDFSASRTKPPGTLVETVVWIVLDRHGRIWLEHRNVSPLRGLWVPPWRDAPSGPMSGTPLGSFRHAITSARYRCEVRAIRGDPAALDGVPGGPGAWFHIDDIRRLPTSSLTMKALRFDPRSGSPPAS